jgi:4-carboxymuconolactone decarboxylase
MDDDGRREQGDATRRAVLGDAHVAAAGARADAFTADFQDFLTRYAWGEVWSRPGLDRRTRSAITLATLTALGRENEIGMHVAAARRNGMSAAEIGEVLLHTALYAGLPAANTAFAIAQRVLADGSAEPAEPHGSAAQLKGGADEAEPGGGTP